jgi:hypothetical protein
MTARTHRVSAALVAVTLLLATRPAGAQDWFVDADRPPGGDGLSWATAFDDLQDALDVVQAGAEIWVAEGIYRPSLVHAPAEPRSATFKLPHEVRIYGGFDGSEARLGQRAGLFDSTILSGDLGVPGDRFDNSFHVVRMEGAQQDLPTVLDGFTIRDGNGLVPGGSQRRGGGLHLTANGQWGPWLLLGNCTVRDNVAESGGGIAVLNLSGLQMRDCVVRDNGATRHGGGVYCLSPGSLRAFNTTWIGNRARADGGAVFLNSTGSDSIWFVNSVFRDNHADRGGAAMLRSGQFSAGTGKWFHCTVAYNHAAGEGGGFHADQGAPVEARLTLANSIVWGNRTSAGATPQIFGGAKVSWSDVQGGWPGAGNLAADPRFLDPLSGNLRTRQGSPAHDSASNALIPFDGLDLDGDGVLLEPVPVDLDGRPRVAADPLAPDVGAGWPGSKRPITDMGAYEHQGG